MTTYYVGIGGSNTAAGTSWAARKLTLNGAEDIPVAEGDTVYVGPGAYREQLTVDVSGSGTGGVITYIGDVTGENTDSVGGVVRITGSDNDTSGARGNCITASSKTHRTFRGFMLDGGTSRQLSATSADTWIVEDCSVHGHGTNSAVNFETNPSNITIRRCVVWGNRNVGIQIWDGSTQRDDTNCLVENCMVHFPNRNNQSIESNRVGGITVKNTVTVGGNVGLNVNNLATGQTVTINNCKLFFHGTAMNAGATGFITEDYNNFFGNVTNRSNTATGGNSVSYIPLSELPLLFDGIQMPWTAWAPTEWEPTGRLAGTGEATDDMFGIVRPATSAKKSWGPIQLQEAERDTGTVDAGSASLKLADAGDHQIFVPTTNASTTFSIEVHREANYAGTNPRMIIRQPGVADDVTTDTGAVSQFNTLTTTLTPAANPPYVIVVLRSLNTSVTGSFATYFDTLDVS